MKILNIPAFGYSLALTAALASAPQPAQALEPLKDYLAAARKNAVVNRMATVNTQILDSKKDETFWRLFPSVSASAGYTYNSNEAVVSTNIGGFNRNVVVSPHNQFDASFGINVPIFDLQAIYKYRAAKAGYGQSQVDVAVAAQQIDLQVSKAYYSYIAAITADTVARKHLETADGLIELAKKRVATGAAQPIEVDRATVERENVAQAQRETKVSMNAAQRSLVTLTGISPTETDMSVPEYLPEETALASWQSEASSLPSVRSAEGGVAIADANVSAAKSAYLPKISATATDRLSNNMGFGQTPNVFTVGVTATINFDLGMPAAVRTQENMRSMARLKVQEALDLARDMIAAAHDQVTLQRSRCESIRYNVNVMRKSAELAYERYISGQASQEELVRAQQELIAVEVTESRAWAELSYDRTLLRIVAGKDLAKGASSMSMR